MTSTLSFDRSFADFGPDVRPEERTDEVLDVVEGFMQRWGYSVRNLVGAAVSAKHLGSGPGDVPDLIFQMAALDYFEIVIRTPGRPPCYGGWLAGTPPVTVSAETVNGRPVLLSTRREGGEIRHVFDPLTGYRPAAASCALPLHAARRLSVSG